MNVGFSYSKDIIIFGPERKGSENYSQHHRPLCFASLCAKHTAWAVCGSVIIPFLGAVVFKGNSLNVVVVDVVLECGEVRALACEVGRELSTFQYERTG